MRNFATTRRAWFLTCGLIIAVASISGRAAEYEVDGTLSQNTIRLQGAEVHATASFTVFVRGCSWLIATTETNEIGAIIRREVGSTNSGEIYECAVILKGVESPNRPDTNGPTRQERSPPPGRAPPRPSIATIISNSVPVGQLDDAVVGHLWLIFASQCYWLGLTTQQLTPVYDWHASVAARGANRTVEAHWELLAGSGSLPREVDYLGQWGETNGLYKVTGTDSIGGMLIPNGFVFEERHVGPLEGNSLIHGMALRKKVIAEVTVVRPVCSRANLLPSPDAKTMVIDLRLPEWTSPSHPPNYINPTVGKWVQLEEAKKLAEVRKNAGDTLHNQPLLLSHHTGVLVTLLCVFMLGPLGIYFLWRRSVKITGKS